MAARTTTKATTASIKPEPTVVTTTARVTAETGLNVRVSKSINADVAYIAKCGDVLDIKGDIKGAWSELTDGNYIRSEFVEQC